MHTVAIPPARNVRTEIAPLISENPASAILAIVVIDVARMPMDLPTPTMDNPVTKNAAPMPVIIEIILPAET
ncbi:MAG: hypothetical protein LBL39_07090, partial [Planctomycetaceae bacterium]|nr:hypothetical protein [Planctomycetaceae bacterium]